MKELKKKGCEGIGCRTTEAYESDVCKSFMTLMSNNNYLYERVINNTWRRLVIQKNIITISSLTIYINGFTTI